MKSKQKTNLTKAVESSLGSIKEALSRTDEQSAKKLIGLILKGRKIFITGQGRSGLLAQCFANRLNQIGFDVSIPGQPTCKKAGRGDLLLAVSCSGTTTITTELAKRCKKAGARIAIITARNNSSLTKLADLKILIPSNYKEVRKLTNSVIGPMNNVVFEEAVMIYLDMIALMILDKKGLPNNLIIKNHTNLE